MKLLTFIALGLLVAAGCAETDDYEVNKPVLSEPAPSTPAVTPETDSDLDVDIDDGADVGESDAPSANIDANIDADTTPDTGGAIETDSLEEDAAPANP